MAGVVLALFRTIPLHTVVHHESVRPPGLGWYIYTSSILTVYTLIAEYQYNDTGSVLGSCQNDTHGPTGRGVTCYRYTDLFLFPCVDKFVYK